MKTFRILVRNLALAALCSLAATLSTTSLAQSYPPAWSNTATYSVGDQVQLNGNVLRAVVATPAPGSFIYSRWELWDVRANTTFMVGVGQTFTNLLTAWNYVHNARVADGAYLHLYISTAKGAFSETFTAPFSLDQGSGAQISILGDKPGNINLTFSACNGFAIDSGHTFGTLENLTMNGAATYTGVAASDLASITQIINVTVNGFGNSFTASRNANLYLPDIAATSYVQAIYADQGATINCPNIRLLQAEGFLGGDLFATRGGIIYANGASLSNADMGCHADYGGMIYAFNCSICGCITGCYATHGGRIYIENNKLGVNVGSGALVNETDLNAKSGGVIDAFLTAGSIPSISIDSGVGSYVYY